MSIITDKNILKRIIDNPYQYAVLNDNSSFEEDYDYQDA